MASDLQLQNIYRQMERQNYLLVDLVKQIERLNDNLERMNSSPDPAIMEALAKIMEMKE